VRERGITGSELPARGALAVTVPGAAALWEDAVKAFGKLSLAQARPCGRLQRPVLGPTLE
jgi:gamma-glutamyltranspeptidase